MKHGKSYLISPSNDDFIIFVAAQRVESALSPMQAESFENVPWWLCARCCNCYRCILRAGRVTGLGAHWLCTLHHHHTEHPAWHGAELCCCCLQKFPNWALCLATTKYHLDMRRWWWFKSFHQVIILRPNCSKQWWNKARDRFCFDPDKKTSFIDEKAVR